MASATSLSPSSQSSSTFLPGWISGTSFFRTVPRAWPAVVYLVMLRRSAELSTSCFSVSRAHTSLLSPFSTSWGSSGLGSGFLRSIAGADMV